MKYKILKQADWGTDWDHYIVMKSTDGRKWEPASDKVFSYMSDAEKYIKEISYENVQIANEGSIS